MSINLSIYPCALYHRKIWRCIFLPLFDTYAKMGNDTGFVQHSSHDYFLSSIFDARIYRVLYRRRLFEMHPEGSSFVDMISFIFSIDSILSYERVRIDLSHRKCIWFSLLEIRVSLKSQKNIPVLWKL